MSVSTRAVLDRWWATRPVQAVAAVAATAGLLLLVFRLGVAKPVPLGILLFGAVTGASYGLIAVALIIVYRSNRVINFALAELGVLGAVLFENLDRAWHWPWAAALVAGVVFTGLVSMILERTIAQRFFRSPRLILTVVTIGLAQIVVFCEFALDAAFGSPLASATLNTPLSSLHLSFGGVVFDGNAVLLLASVPVIVLLLDLFLGRTSWGVATRAASENLDRAALLGVPVKTVSTLSWGLAGVIVAIAVELRSPVVGLISGSTLIGPDLLLRALTAAVIARFESIGVAVVAGLAVGVVEQGLYYAYGGSNLSDAVFVGFIIAALLFQRSESERADSLRSSSWALIEEDRPLPPELASLLKVRVARAGWWLVLASAVIVVPALLSSSSIYLASEVVIIALVGISLVVLMGWSGQISLGQLGIAALGAATVARLTADLHWDFIVSLLVGSAVGAAAALLLGVAAFRIRGFYFAVTSLAFAVAVETFFLNPTSFPLLALVHRPERPLLLSRFDLSGELAYYYFCLALLVVVVLAVVALRRSRTGRVLIAMRDNDRAARSFGISRTRTHLLGFALSGYIAGLAGGLLAIHDQAVVAGTYSPEASITVFSMVVVGGLGSIRGAIAGTVAIEGAILLLPPQWSPLVAGAGLLLVLLIMPGGLGRAMTIVRDALVVRLVGRPVQYAGTESGDVTPILAGFASATNKATSVVDPDAVDEALP